jgi:ABC-type antimicrobial peptide transport system permease subunit
MLAKLALRNLIKNRTRSLSVAVSVTISSALLAFIACVVYILQTNISKRSGLLPISDFLNLIGWCLGFIILIIVVSSALFIYNSLSFDSEERTRMFGLLISAGATRFQISIITWLELLVLSIFAIPLGIAAGVGGATAVVRLVLNTFDFSALEIEQFNMNVPGGFILILIITAIIPVITGATVPLRRAVRTTAISAIKGSDEKAVNEKRSYRKSRAFNKMPVIKQLAWKNFDYHIRKYRLTAISLSLSVLIFITGGIIFHYIKNVVITVDKNPYDGNDTIASGINVITGIFGLLGIISLLLVALAFANAINTYLHNIRTRRREFAIYRSVGMDMDQMKHMIIDECMHIGIKAIVYCLVTSSVISCAMSILFLYKSNAAVVFYFPLLPVLLNSVLIIILMFVISVISCRYINKLNTIESLKCENF